MRKAVQELKRAPCSDCGRTYNPVCMDFDHRPGEDKLRTVAQTYRRGMKAVMAEIAKCDLVCSNCHRVRTETRRLQSVELRQALGLPPRHEEY